MRRGLRQQRQNDGRSQEIPHSGSDRHRAGVDNPPNGAATRRRRELGDQRLRQMPGAQVRNQRVRPIAKNLKHVAPQLLGFLLPGLPEVSGNRINNRGLGRGQTGPVDVISFAITRSCRARRRFEGQAASPDRAAILAHRRLATRIHATPSPHRDECSAARNVRCWSPISITMLSPWTPPSPTQTCRMIERLIHAHLADPLLRLRQFALQAGLLRFKIGLPSIELVHDRRQLRHLFACLRHFVHAAMSPRFATATSSRRHDKLVPHQVELTLDGVNLFTDPFRHRRRPTPSVTSSPYALR